MMTVTLTLPPNAEAAAKAAAQAEGVAIENYLQSFLESHLLGQKQDPTGQERREAALNRIQNGFYARQLLPSEDFAAQKEEEKRREERHWRDDA